MSGPVPYWEDEPGIGIEIEEEHCAVAASRLEAGFADEERKHLFSEAADGR